MARGRHVDGSAATGELTKEHQQLTHSTRSGHRRPATTPPGRFFLHIIASLAQIKRGLIVARTRPTCRLSRANRHCFLPYR